MLKKLETKQTKKLFFTAVEIVPFEVESRSVLSQFYVESHSKFSPFCVESHSVLSLF
jgi:hypothetical protein